MAQNYGEATLVFYQRSGLSSSDQHANGQGKPGEQCGPEYGFTAFCFHHSSFC
jgi:hypothetical protein